MFAYERTKGNVTRKIKGRDWHTHTHTWTKVNFNFLFGGWLWCGGAHGHTNTRKPRRRRRRKKKSNEKSNNETITLILSEKTFNWPLPQMTIRTKSYKYVSWDKTKANFFFFLLLKKHLHGRCLELFEQWKKWIEIDMNSRSILRKMNQSSDMYI